MSLGRMQYAFEARTETPLQKLVLIALADGMDVASDGILAFCRADAADVFDAFDALHEQGFLPLPDEQGFTGQPPLSASVRRALIIAAGECASCGATDRLCVDHIIPVRRGGTNDLSNLQVLCAPCNTSKESKLMSEWGGRVRRP